MLQRGENQAAHGLLTLGARGETALANLAVFHQQVSQLQFGCIGWQPFDLNLLENAFRKSAGDFTDVILQTAHHDVSQLGLHDRNTRGEALVVEEMQQSAEAVRVAVVGRGREKKSVFEPWC